MWIAHKNEDGQREQSILEHLKGTANRAQEFANPFGCGEYGRCLGMLHDIGKYSEGFRERILNGEAARWTIPQQARSSYGSCQTPSTRESPPIVLRGIIPACRMGAARPTMKRNQPYPPGYSALWRIIRLSARKSIRALCFQPRSLPCACWEKRALPFLSLLECFTPAWWTPIFSTRSASCPTAASRATRGNRFPYCVANWHNI